MQCPKCGQAQCFEGEECERCGVIFARVAVRGASQQPGVSGATEAPETPHVPEASPLSEPAGSHRQVEPPRAIEIEDDVAIGRRGWAAFATGAVLAVSTELLPILQVFVGYFVVLVHELGHAVAGWLFGYPSVPAFDFTYGGGVTLHQQQVPLLVGLVFAGLGWMGWLLRPNRAGVALVAALTAIYALLLATSGHEIAMVAMGHGGELVFATLFLHRALSGRGCKLEAERPLYAWIGFHIVFHDLRFAWGLLTSGFAREMYEDAKGGGHWMDFSRLAEEFFRVPLETVAFFFLLMCLLPPAFAVALNLAKGHLAELAERATR